MLRTESADGTNAHHGGDQINHLTLLDQCAISPQAQAGGDAWKTHEMTCDTCVQIKAEYGLYFLGMIESLVGIDALKPLQNLMHFPSERAV